jgi:mRNA interferase MazF
MIDYRARQGDIIWITLDPRIGHEQKGRRPALVVSNNTFHNITNSAAMICPITHKDKGFPFQITLDGRTQTKGIVMCDQAKILDIKKHDAAFIEKAPDDLVAEAADIIWGFVEIEE